MSEVKRYELTEMGPTYHKRTEMLLSDEGCWVDYEDYVALKAELDALAAENVALKSAISYVCDTDNQPDYQYDGMGCGIEDRGIIDRYEGARYGWDEALERMYSEVIPCASDIETPATDAYLNSVRAEGVEMFAAKLTEMISQEGKPNSHHGYAYIAMNYADKLRAGEPS